MTWYKIQKSPTLDARLTAVARRAGLRRGEAVALWIAVLDHAARAEPRGSISDIDMEDIAAALEFDAAVAERALKAFSEKRMITPAGRIAGWDKMHATSTHRTRAHRARRKAADEDAQKFSRLHESTEDIAARRARLQKMQRDDQAKRGRHFSHDHPPAR